MRPPSQKLVWLVDDNEEFRSVAEALFSGHQQYSLLTFASAEPALQAGKDGIEAPDALFLDIELPGMSGIEAIDHFKQTIPQTKIIILSNFDKDPYIQEAFQKKVDGYLLKPFDMEEVIGAIDAALQGGVRVDQKVMAKVARLIGFSPPAAKDYGLTEREVEVLTWLRNGLHKPQIARKLHISINTVKSHLHNAYQKLRVHSETAAVVKLIREHILPDSTDNDPFLE